METGVELGLNWGANVSPPPVSNTVPVAMWMRRSGRFCAFTGTLKGSRFSIVLHRTHRSKPGTGVLMMSTGR